MTVSRSLWHALVASVLAGATVSADTDSTGIAAIFVLFFVPALLVYIFWMVHILPEKIAERRGHPQADAERYLQAVLGQDAEGARLGRVRYQAGATNFLDVLQLQTRQLNTRFELIRVRNDRLANRIALHLALGGGFEPVQAP